MRFTRETVHEPRGAEKNIHMSSKVIEAKPFFSARVKQGGYGMLADDFWLWRTPQRGFHAVVYTLSGHGRIIMDDGTELNVGEGDVFISSPSGQGHYEETPEGRIWEMLWITFWEDTDVCPDIDDYEVRNFTNGNDLRERVMGLFREELYQDIHSDMAMELYEELFLVSLKRSLGMNESSVLQRHRQEFSMLWTRVASSLSAGWTLDDISEATGYSKSHVTRICIDLYSKTPGEMVQDIRMQQAKVMLVNSVQSVDRISALLGYSRVSAFSYAFGKYYGMSPREYRNMYGNMVKSPQSDRNNLLK
ncbi:MAG: AraC family transcriptional regulator [Bullifex sp.]